MTSDLCISKHIEQFAIESSTSIAVQHCSPSGRTSIAVQRDYYFCLVALATLKPTYLRVQDELWDLSLHLSSVESLYLLVQSKLAADSGSNARAMRGQYIFP